MCLAALGLAGADLGQLVEGAVAAGAVREAEVTLPAATEAVPMLFRPAGVAAAVLEPVAVAKPWPLGRAGAMVALPLATRTRASPTSLWRHPR